jgi:hypothetical protein
MFDEGPRFEMETALPAWRREQTPSGRWPEPKAEVLASNRKGDHSHGFIGLRIFGSGIQRPVRCMQTLMQAPCLRVTLATQTGGSDGAAQHADGDGFDAGAHAKALLRPLDVEVRRRRLDCRPPPTAGTRSRAD